MKNEKKQNPIIEKVMRITEKLSAEVHLRAVRDAFLLTIPFLVLSGFMTFIAYVLLAEDSIVYNAIPGNVSAAIISICSKTINGGQNILALLMVLLVSYNLAKYKKYHNPLMAALISLGALFIMMPDTLSYTPIGTNGMFVSLITALLVTEAFLALSKQDKLKLKISGNVPPAITESFNSMFVIIIIELLVAVLAFACNAISGMGVHDMINAVLQKPLVGVATTLPAFLCYFGFGQCLLQ